jgi:hypothetical protein
MPTVAVRTSVTDAHLFDTPMVMSSAIAPRCAVDATIEAATSRRV